MSTHKTNTTPTNFDGIHVSKGFVRGLQGQVLKLEQNQQLFIQQLEHANRLATEYHASAVSWQQKYDAALHEKDEMLLAFQAERIQWSETISPDHPHRDAPCEAMSPVSIPSSSPRKPPTAISAHDREYIQHQLLIDQDPTPFDEDDERVVVRDGKRFKQWMQYGFGNVPCYGEREMTMSENEEYEKYDENEHDSDSDSYDSSYCGEFGHYPREYNWEREAREARAQGEDQNQEYDEGNDAYSQSSRTTNCSGDPICHSYTE